jgi:type 2 lantibiotic (TIGR03893 family)
MNRNEAMRKVSMSNPAGSLMPEMTIEEMTRVQGGGDVQAETTPSTMLCVNVGIRMSSQKCAYVAGNVVGGAISVWKC